MTDYSLHLVIDNGSSTIKAGFNGENVPKLVIPTVTGKYKDNNLNFLLPEDYIFVGNDALINSSILDLNYPLLNSGNPDFNNLEQIWNYLFFNELRVSPEAHNVFLTEPNYTSDKSRETMAEIMFEKFNIFNIHIEPQSTMTLFSTTKTTGLVIESGDSLTQILPIYEGYIIQQGIRYMELAGRDLTIQFEKLLNRHIVDRHLSNTFEYAKKIKEKFCTFRSEKSSDNNFIKEYILPDNTTFTIKDEEIYNISEGFLNPELLNKDISPIHTILNDSLESCDINIRKELAQNIVLGGGNSMINGLPENLKMNLEKNMHKKYQKNIKINAQNERKYSSWIGSSVVCSIGTFQNMWISKNEYEEVGARVLHRKIFG